jgi:diguanylate cyclase (GGDEF)-like protein
MQDGRGFGLLMAAAGVLAYLAAGLYLLPKYVERALLDDDAQLIAHHWADHVAGRTGLSDAVYHDSSEEHAESMHEVAGRGEGTGNGLHPGHRMEAGTAQREPKASHDPRMSMAQAPDERMAGVFHSGRHVSNVGRYAVFAANGAIIHASESYGVSLHGTALLDEAEKAAFNAAIDRNIVGNVRTDTANSVRTTVFIPLMRNRQTVGAMLVEVDQSQAALLISAALRKISFATTVMLMLALAGTLFLFWRRIQDRLSAQRQIRFLAHHDALTGLPNRALFLDRLAYALEIANKMDVPVGLLIIDVDKFKQVNDTFGHPVGDGLVKAVAANLTALVDGNGFVSRLSGDEFAIVVNDQCTPASLHSLCQRVHERLALPINAAGVSVQITVSVGVAQGPGDGEDTDMLIRNADLALYRAKADGRARTCFFEPEMDAKLRERYKIERDLRQALDKDEFQLCFQPQLSISSGEVRSYEALLRWRHPVDGLRPPADFIPVAEESGLIEPIGEWVLRTACAAIAALDDETAVAVNVSPVQFRLGRIDTTIREVLDRTGLSAHRLEIEITESLLLADTDETLATLERIQAMGVRVAMDDFGTGYSSLNYLSRFPFDKIKIDRSFIENLGQNRQVDAVVATIVGLGRSLDVEITAEGVETEKQATLLRAVGCGLAQGFLYGRPGPLPTSMSRRAVGSTSRSFAD